MPTYYINADTGNDSTGTGTSANPWLTISKAHDSAADGDTIICQDSTATYNFASKTFTKGLIIQGEQDDASGAVFDGASLSRQWTLTSNFTYTFQKVTFQNTITDIIFVVQISGQYTISFDNCIFKDNQVGINLYTGIVASTGGGINGTVLFQNTLFLDCYNIASNGPIFLLRQAGGALTYSLINCTVYFSAGLSNPPDFVFRQQDAATALTVICKNTIMQNDNAAAVGVAKDVTPTYSYSCFDGFSDTPTGTGVITGDPLFADAANGDFRLQRDSPCIATGVLV